MGRTLRKVRNLKYGAIMIFFYLNYLISMYTKFLGLTFYNSNRKLKIILIVFLHKKYIFWKISNEGCWALL